MDGSAYARRRIVFFPMNVNHPAWPEKTVSAVTDAAFTDLFLSGWLVTLSRQKKTSTIQQRSGLQSALTWVGYWVTAQIARRELTFTIFFLPFPS